MNDRTPLNSAFDRTRPPSPTKKLAEALHNASKRLIPAIIVVATLFFLFRPVYVFKSDSERKDYLRSIGARTDIRVIILTTEWCPACKQLEGQLTAEGVEFLKLDIERTGAGRELFKKVADQTLSTSIPKVIIDNKVVGPTNALMDIKTLGTITK